MRTAPIDAIRANPRGSDLTALDALTAAIRLDSRHDRHGLADPFVVGEPATNGWIPASALVDGTALALLLDGPTERWGAAPHVAAALAWKAYTHRLTLPAVLGLACLDRVPLLDADNVLVRLSYERPYVTVGVRRPAVAVLPGDRFAGAPDVTVVPDRAALLDVLRTQLVDRHLGPLGDATRARVRLGSRTLAGALAAAVGYALRYAETVLPPVSAAGAYEILHALDVSQLVELWRGPDGDLEVQRKTCCLAFTVPDLDICDGCCIRR